MEKETTCQGESDFEEGQTRKAEALGLGPWFGVWGGTGGYLVDLLIIFYFVKILMY